MSTRLYLVIGPDAAPRLIEATAPSVARSHCAKSAYTVEPAKAMDVAKLVASGTVVEKAGVEPPGATE